MRIAKFVLQFFAYRLPYVCCSLTVIDICKKCFLLTVPTVFKIKDKLLCWDVGNLIKMSHKNKINGQFFLLFFKHGPTQCKKQILA